MDTSPDRLSSEEEMRNQILDDWDEEEFECCTNESYEEYFIDFSED